MGFYFIMNFKSMHFSYRCLILMALGLMLAGFSAGCSAFQQSDEELLSVIVRLDKDVYRPGEMVVAEVEVVNATDETIVIEQPFSVDRKKDSNVHIRMTPTDVYDPLRYSPIEIRDDIEASLVMVPPYQSRRAKFAFTLMTKARGDFLIWADYDRAPYRFKDPDGRLVSENLEKVEDFFKVASEPVVLKVEGERVFNRTAAGILTNRAAIDVARRAYGGPVKGARVALVEAEGSALYDYWVTLIKPDGSEGIEGTDTSDNVEKADDEKYVSYFVSPYGGFVRREQVAHMTENPSEFKLEQMKKSLKKTSQKGTILKPLTPIGGKSSAAPSAPGKSTSPGNGTAR